ncbi:hypothetical protein [uncultured Draconibacterium sp.]|uniref:hypothetical protein n=1 Tax=uncultured Draconibacterium sp. TaxID=1573823 RepID=UPI0025F56F03|nr:hypothetical protein [uncultured Draconibacterium sp.]
MDGRAGMYTNDRDSIIVPAHGIYACNVDGHFIKNTQMHTLHNDERPSITLDEVKNFNQTNVFDERVPLKTKDINVVNNQK